MDLKDPANARKSKDLRFLRKILTDSEIDQVRDSFDPDRTLWSLWACKEAAFKVMQKITGDAAFMPRRWFVFLQPGGQNVDGHDRRQNRQFPGVIQIPRGHDIPCLLCSTPAYIHCIAADSPNTLAQSIGAVNTLPCRREKPGHDASAFGRLCLAGRIESLFSGKAGSVEIRRVEEEGILKPPTVYLNGMPAKVDVSLSHDGRFTAYAIVLL